MTTVAERLPVCACRARQTACWMSRQIQVNSRGDCDGAATASVRQTSVAFAVGRKQNAALKSDRQSEPLPLTPQSHGPAPLLLRVGMARETTNTLGLQTVEQFRVDLSPYREQITIYKIPFPKPLNLGSTDPSSHCSAVLLGG